MSSVFTDYVRALGADPLGSEHRKPNREQCIEVWQRLRTLVVVELHKRDMWHAPPAYFGVYGGASWSQEETLEELLAECYTFIFVRRLRALKAQLSSKANLDGLILLNVRHFFYDTQKKHDPLGFRVFDIARSAVLRCLERDTLVVLEGDPKVLNATLLGSVSEADPSTVDRVDLSERIQHWNDDLMPELVTARGSGLAPVLDRLESRLAALKGEGVEAFRFKDLVDPLKDDARHRWSTFWQLAEGETAPQLVEQGAAVPVRLVPPDSSYEERQGFERLVACVSEAVARLPGRARTRAYLARLWLFERERCVTAQDSGTLSRRKIGALLDIPRHRLPGLYETLGRLIEDCRQCAPQTAQTPSAAAHEERRPRKVAS